MPNQPSVRVVVKLPYNRPDNPPHDPPTIEWTAEKADILWKVIERSRSVDSAGADWKGLAAHLEVPLPYLLYRVNARFQEEIRGLRDIQGALSPSSAQPTTTGGLTSATSPHHDFPAASGAGGKGDRPVGIAGRLGMLGSGGGSRHLSGSRIGVRARLNSLGQGVGGSNNGNANNNSRQAKKPTSSSTLTLQAGKRPSYGLVSVRPVTPLSSESESEDEEAIKEEEAERNAEEEDALTKKLAALQKMMTIDTLGLVSGARARGDKGKGKDNRGRSAPLSPRSAGSSRVDTLSSRSQSISSASSPQGSIPDMPMSGSPSSESQPHSPPARNRNQNFSPHKAPSSPPAVSSKSAQGHHVNHQSQRRFGPLVDRTSDIGSSHGSEASSFSDLSDASISASALESALLSNLGSNGSRLQVSFCQFDVTNLLKQNLCSSQFTRSRPSNRTHSVVPQ
ncbi:hypothetical protein JR316_0004376 [Psilocybe cubensis]|uniref:Uncharacterized protein n=1 Tax=Psilocybe cubensis TaxID=181762 RepID=A0ACB8H3A7_PSICU|nr:hypothetical protein JR316_0004376 [Psilocybe cubensis]KAH9482278.1 hypothetical protein JR316_0004376 [Psilocybe cubensis]